MTKSKTSNIDLDQWPEPREEAGYTLVKIREMVSKLLVETESSEETRL